MKTTHSPEKMFKLWSKNMECLSRYPGKVNKTLDRSLSFPGHLYCYSIWHGSSDLKQSRLKEKEELRFLFPFLDRFQVLSYILKPRFKGPIKNCNPCTNFGIKQSKLEKILTWEEKEIAQMVANKDVRDRNKAHLWSTIQSTRNENLFWVLRSIQS